MNGKDTKSAPALGDLIRISKSVGGKASFVQGGGGNTSVKTADGKHMYIKASGVPIKDIGERRGWRKLAVASVRAILDAPDLRKMAEAEREAEVVRRLQDSVADGAPGGARPSVESHLHALLGRCVVHLHPVAVGAYVCAKNGKAQLEKLFGDDDLPPVWVPYTRPGYMLGAKVARLVAAYARRHGQIPGVLFLQNHGLLVTADTAARVVREVSRVIGLCQSGLTQPRIRSVRRPNADAVAAAQTSIRRALWETTGRRLAVKHFIDRAIAGLMARPDARQLASSAPLTPDELAYVGNSAMWLSASAATAVARKIEAQIRRGERPSAAFLVEGLGLFAAGSDRTIPIVREVTTASFLIRGHAVDVGGIRSLPKAERQFIMRWEGERYRRQVAVGSEGGELAGRIAVVTGAASGLGRSIAIGLGRAGASVALADVDREAAGETANMLREAAPGASSTVVVCDVTAERNVEAALRAIRRLWGGVDILVNAAGIAPAHSLVDLPLAEWRAALDVNLTGYFLMAREAARLMIEQGMGGSIINISSKSGLEASKSNTPYNATKAGELHMARGWALELGPHGIRVNSVAPGNVFEGSKIWNPGYIKMCAEKHGIKPDEVIPYYVNMTALKRRITGQDVADAVTFLCSDKARTITGQTIVSDSGQVMVR